MPQIFRIDSYIIYLWSFEGTPLEPVHVHIAEGTPQENATKIWITRTGKAMLANNKSKISDHELNTLMRMIETRSFEIISKWKERDSAKSVYIANQLSKPKLISGEIEV